MSLLGQFEAEGIEIDDIRWYLSRLEAERVLTYRDDLDALANLIHSGRLEADWYRMEERYIERLEEKLAAHTTDDGEISKNIREVDAARTLRNAEAS